MVSLDCSAQAGPLGGAFDDLPDLLSTRFNQADRKLDSLLSRGADVERALTRMEQRSVSTMEQIIKALEDQRVVAPMDRHGEKALHASSTAGSLQSAALSQERSHHSYFDHQGMAMDLPCEVPGREMNQESPNGNSVHDTTEPSHDPTSKDKARRSLKRAKKKTKALDERISWHQSTVYHMEDHYKETGWPAQVARSPWLEQATTFFTLANCLFIGLDADMNDSPYLYNSHWVYIAHSQFFAIYFTLELLVRLFAMERALEAFKDQWFKFDFFVVVTMDLDVWVFQPLIIAIMSEEQGRITIPTQPLRILRLFKLMRMVRIMQAFPELLTMLVGFGRSLRAIISTFALIFILMYVWGVLLRMLMGDKTSFNNHLKQSYDFEFGSLVQCLWCLLMDGVLQLDNAGLIMTDMMFSSDAVIVLSGILFTAFSLLSAIMILQMLIGVMCDVVSQVGEEQRHAKHLDLVRDKLHSELKAITQDGDQVLRHEFAQFAESESFVGILDELRINPLFFSDLASIFYIDAGAQVPVGFLLELLLLCRGDNLVTVDLISFVLNFLNNEFVDMEHRIVLQIREVLYAEGGIRVTMDRPMISNTLEGEQEQSMDHKKKSEGIHHADVPLKHSMSL